MNTHVEAADGQFTTLFANAKYFIETTRARQADPELARLRAHYTGQLAALRDAVSKRKANVSGVASARRALMSAGGAGGGVADARGAAGRDSRRAQGALGGERPRSPAESDVVFGVDRRCAPSSA